MWWETFYHRVSTSSIHIWLAWSKIWETIYLCWKWTTSLCFIVESSIELQEYRAKMWLVKHCVFTGYQCPPYISAQRKRWIKNGTVCIQGLDDGAIKKPAFLKNVKWYWTLHFRWGREYSLLYKRSRQVSESRYLSPRICPRTAQPWGLLCNSRLRWQAAQAVQLS